MPASITRGKTFGSTEQVTNTKLHQLVDGATIAGVDASNMASGFSGVTRSTSAPSVTDGLWADTNCSPAVVKFYNGSAWVPLSGFVYLLNNSGGSLAAGDVAIMDSTTAGAATTTTTAGSTACPVVAMQSIASGASGVFATTGSYVTNINCNGAVAKGQFLKTHSAVKQAVATSTPDAGVFAIALSSLASSGALAQALMIGPNLNPAAGRTGATNLLSFNNAGTPNTKIDMTADAAVLTDTSNNLLKILSFSQTADCTTVGANGLDAGALANSTLYALWAIAKGDGTSALLVSTSFTAPTMPTGYTYKFLYGQARTDGSAHFLKFHQQGRKHFYDATPAAYNAIPGAGTWVSVDLSTYISTTLAKNGKFILSAGSASQASAMTNDNSVSVAIGTAAANKVNQNATASYCPQDFVEFSIITASTVYVVGSSTVIVYVVGFDITSW